MKFTRVMIAKSLKPIVNIVILVSVATAAFKLGQNYQSSKKDDVKMDNPYAHALSLIHI